jgi:hypothetical protein
MDGSVSHRLSGPVLWPPPTGKAPRGLKGISMKALFEFRPTTGKWTRRIAATSMEMVKRGIAMGLVGLMIPMGIAQVSAFAQDAPPPPPDQQPQYDQGAPVADEGAPPPQQWQTLSPDQLNQLVAPIALYPDSLVAQVLAAATYPSQVADADRFVQSQGGVPPSQIAEEANNMNWDPSVKALCAFPSVLANMDKNMEWTTNLGNAYYNQPQDVMSAVQNLRQQAYQAGHLQSSPQLAVTYAPNDIVIAPANPAVVYVPYYDPWVYWGFHPYYAWYAPPPPIGWRVGLGFGFGVGIAVGLWGGWGWGWGHWGFAWGPHPYVAFNHVTYVSRSVTVFNHGYYGRFDRAPGAIANNAPAAVQVRNVSYTHVTEVNNNRTVINNNRTYNNTNINRTNNNFNRTNNYNNSNHNTYNNNSNHTTYNSNYNRPNTGNTNNHPAQGTNNTYNRPANNNYNRPANNNANHPNNENRPAQHNEGKQGGGGEHPNKGGEHPEKEGHPHER